MLAVGKTVFEIINLPLKSNLKIVKRMKNGPNHWATLARKSAPKQKALEHFDDLYGSLFDKLWPSIRLGLLCANKFCAVVNNYSDTGRIISHLESLGAVELGAVMAAERERLKQARPHRKRRSSKSDRVQSTVETIGHDLYQEEQIMIQHSLSTPPVGRVIGRGDLGSLDEFVPAEKLLGQEDWLRESEHFEYYPRRQQGNLPIEVEHDELHYPNQLRVYSFVPAVTDELPPPTRGSTHVSDYYLLDGGSVLPVLALGLEPGDSVLDMCSAPGGKALLCLQSLFPSRLVCNDVSESRLRRVERVMKEFLYDYEEKMKTGELEIRKGDARKVEGELFDKVLVDVPCTTDRHSVHQTENNIFKSTRLKERVHLPQLQSDILTNALKQVKVGGSVVYSTCSLSPVQNEGVVHMALTNIWRETSLLFKIMNLKAGLEPMKAMYRLCESPRPKYGDLVLPYLPSNFGPTYFCKMTRIS